MGYLVCFMNNKKTMKKSKYYILMETYYRIWSLLLFRRSCYY